MKPDYLVRNMDIKNPFGNTKLSNLFIIHEEDSYPLLKAVYEGTAPYTSDAYGMLSNSLERLYKGILLELQQIYPEEIVIPRDIEKTHTYTRIAIQINKYLPISKTRDGCMVIFNHLDKIAEGYTSSRYRAIYEKTDFDKAYRRYNSQRERLLMALDAERSKYESRDAMEADYGNEDDFDLD